MGTSELRSLKEFSWLHLTKSELPCVRLGGISVQSCRGVICHLGRQGWELGAGCAHEPSVWAMALPPDQQDASHTHKVTTDTRPGSSSKRSRSLGIKDIFHSWAFPSYSLGILAFCKNKATRSGGKAVEKTHPPQFETIFTIC